MKKSDLHKMLMWLSQVLTCPVCDGHYTSENTRVIENRLEKNSERRGDDSTVIVHSECKNCRTSVMFNVALVGPEVFSVGVISDLTARDAFKFRVARPISADDVINMHNFLNTFDGNFERVFAGM